MADLVDQITRLRLKMLEKVSWFDVINTYLLYTYWHGFLSLLLTTFYHEAKIVYEETVMLHYYIICLFRDWRMREMTTLNERVQPFQQVSYTDKTQKIFFCVYCIIVFLEFFYHLLLYYISWLKLFVLCLT